MVEVKTGYDNDLVSIDKESFDIISLQELVGPEKFTVFYIRQNLRCFDPVEILYYSAGYPSCCSHCGMRRAAKLSTGTNEYPMCIDSRRAKKKPIQRRKAFNKIS